MSDPGAHETQNGIVTPEGVVLSFMEAGLGSRALAFLIDLLIRAAAVVALVYAIIAVRGSAEMFIIFWVITIFSLLLVYPVVFEVAMRGQTPGKMALGLRVVTVEGGPVRFRHAAVRSGLGLVDFVVTSGVVAIVTSLLNRRSQRLGDIVAGTMVVRERSARTNPYAIAFAPPPGWEPFTDALDTSALTMRMANLVREFLLRVHTLESGARWRLAWQLASRVADRIGTPIPPSTSPELYLVCVVAAHQRSHADHTGPAVSAPGPPPPPPTPYAPAVPVDDLAPTWGR